MLRQDSVLAWALRLESESVRVSLLEPVEIQRTVLQFESVSRATESERLWEST